MKSETYFAKTKNAGFPGVFASGFHPPLRSIAMALNTAVIAININQLQITVSVPADAQLDMYH